MIKHLDELSISNKLLDMQSSLDLSILSNEKVDGKFSTIDELWTFRKLALLVELSEVANELRSFKYWSNKQRSSDSVVLEELSDVLHFVLSLILTYHSNRSIHRVDVTKIDNKDLILGRYYYKYNLEYLTLEKVEESTTNRGISEATLAFTQYVANLSLVSSEVVEVDRLLTEYWKFITILGYSIEDLYSAYIEKNEENYNRLESGY